MTGTLQQTHREDLSGGGPAIHEEPAVYLALEGERPLAGGLRASLANVNEVRFGRGTERSFKVEPGGIATFEVPDRRMSTKHARLVRESDGWLLEDSGSTTAPSSKARASRRRRSTN